MTTKAGEYVVSRAIWNEGMRGHFTRMFALTGPDDFRIMVTKIEEEAVAEERERVKKLDWSEVMLDALCGSDDGNNPFYRDEEDTLALSEQLAAAILRIVGGS